MNLLASSDFTYYLKNVFADWAIALFIFFAVLILLAVLFKGLKVGAVLFVIAAVVAGGFVLAAFINMLLTWDSLRIIDFAIKWGPTILFVTIITISTLVNAKRGLRKSLILLAQAVGACVVCLIFFYVCANSKEVDKFILSATNFILGGGTALQDILGVSADCSTLREVFAEFLPNILGGDFKILLSENPQYLVTLADMAFRVVFSVITILIYLQLVFILYIIYFFAYPERRYKKRVNLAVTKNAAARPYSKHHLGGGAVGLVRGITVGLLSLSFMGSTFFMIAGGKGNGTLGDYDFENDDYNYFYSIYRSIDSYGSQGIFKILNAMTDASDTPFYLFAADMVLSGNLDDEENDIHNKNIKFREEFAAFTGFAKDTLNLLLKYGEDDIVAIINGKGGANAFDTIVDIMAIPGFRAEFDELITEFDEQTYIINFGISLVNSIVANIDDISFASAISEDNRELIKILFKKGYLSDVIPDERELKQDIEAGVIKPTDYATPPRIKVSHLLNKDDIRLVLGVALSFISGEIKTDDALAMVKTLLPDIKQLSILQTSRASELDPVLARLYCYLDNKYLTTEGSDGITYKAVADENIKWLSEIRTLLDVADSALTLWENIYEEGKQPLDMALGVFDPDNPDYEENVKCFDNIRSALETSDIIGVVMSTSFMHDMLTQAFEAVSKDFYMPENLVYSRKVNADGSVVMGEMYYLLGGFRLITSPDNRELLDKAMEFMNGGDIDTTELLIALSDALKKQDDDGNSLSAYFSESYLLRSLLSIVMIEYGGDTLYIPSVSLDKINGVTVNMINKRELKELLDNLSVLVGFVDPLLKGDNDSEHIETIAKYLQDEEFARLVKNNRIYEGTVANLLSIFIKSNRYVVVPNHLLESVDGWVTVIEDGADKPGELRNLINALKVAEVDLADIAKGNFDANELFDKLTSLDRYDAEDFLKSEILHYTISNYLIEGTEAGGFEIIVPNGARENANADDSIDYLVKKSELINLFEAVAKLELSDESDISSVLYKIVVNKDIFDSSKIISASVICTIANNRDIKNAISIPDNYLEAGSREALLDYNSSNVWKAELPRFIDALDEILGISKSGEDFEFDSDSIKESLESLLTKLNEKVEGRNITKLQLCYLSDIVRSEITVRLDDVLLRNDIVPEEVLADAKSHGYYKEEELEALVSALEIFGIDDLLTAEGSDIVDKVTAMALGLNDLLGDDYDGKYKGKTTLDVIYPSNIIKYIFSREIDKALEGHIEQSVINYIKDGRSTYPQKEIAAFIDAVNEIGVEDFNDIGSFELSQVGNLEVIYASRIAAGVITKSLYEALNSLEILSESQVKYKVDHSKAYETDVKIYKFVEIESIFDIFGDLEKVDNIMKADLGKISKCLYDDNGVTHSYLLASLASAIFKSNDAFIIPVTALDEEGCILPRETALILEGFSAIYDGTDLENMDSWEISAIPEKGTREKLFASVIMRARITYEFAEVSYNSSEGHKLVYVSPENLSTVLDIDGRTTRYIISEKEFNALADALDAISGGEGQSVFEVPKFTLPQILQFDEAKLGILLKSDVMLHKLSECLLENPEIVLYLTSKGITPDMKEARELHSGHYQEMPVLSAEAILKVYSDFH